MNINNEYIQVKIQEEKVKVSPFRFNLVQNKKQKHNPPDEGNEN